MTTRYPCQHITSKLQLTCVEKRKFMEPLT